MRLLLLILFWTSLPHAGEPVKATVHGVCNLPLFGTQLDIATTPPIHLLYDTRSWERKVQLHVPTQARLLDCNEYGCEYSKTDAQATITLDTDNRGGTSGTYSITYKDGTKQEGRFVAGHGKQKGPAVCL
jgi:hypothetical protein